MRWCGAALTSLGDGLSILPQLLLVLHLFPHGVLGSVGRLHSLRHTAPEGTEREAEAQPQLVADRGRVVAGVIVASECAKCSLGPVVERWWRG